MTDPAMTTAQLRDILRFLQWSQREMARRGGLDESRVRKMCRDRESIDADIAAWIRKEAAAALALDKMRRGRLAKTPPSGATPADPWFDVDGENA